jgi:hypothetical protein
MLLRLGTTEIESENFAKFMLHYLKIGTDLKTCCNPYSDHCDIQRMFRNRILVINELPTFASKGHMTVVKQYLWAIWSHFLKSLLLKHWKRTCRDWRNKESLLSYLGSKKTLCVTGSAVRISQIEVLDTRPDSLSSPAYHRKWSVGKGAAVYSSFGDPQIKISTKCWRFWVILPRLARCQTNFLVDWFCVLFSSRPIKFNFNLSRFSIRNLPCAVDFDWAC